MFACARLPVCNRRFTPAVAGGAYARGTDLQARICRISGLPVSQPFACLLAEYCRCSRASGCYAETPTPEQVARAFVARQQAVADYAFAARAPYKVSNTGVYFKIVIISKAADGRYHVYAFNIMSRHFCAATLIRSTLCHGHAYYRFVQPSSSPRREEASKKGECRCRFTRYHHRRY